MMIGDRTMVPKARGCLGLALVRYIAVICDPRSENNVGHLISTSEESGSKVSGWWCCTC
jgi:hypothetical protein